MSEKNDKKTAPKPANGVPVRFVVTRNVPEGEGKFTRYEGGRTYLVTPDRASHLVSRGQAEYAEGAQGVVDAEPEPISAEDKAAQKAAEVEAKEQAERDAKAAEEAATRNVIETASVAAPEAATTGDTPAPRTVGKSGKAGASKGKR